MHHFARGLRSGETDRNIRTGRCNRRQDSDFRATEALPPTRCLSTGDSLARVTGKSLDDLSTPAVLVDLDVLERNIARMAGWARDAGVRLRPHAKTHKCPQIARLQRAAGAWGLSLAKVG